MSFKKGHIEHIEAHFKRQPPMLHFPGFIRRDVLLNQQNEDIDIVRMIIYWESKEAYYRFEGSPEHIAMHRDKNNPHHQKPEGLIDVKREAYHVIASDIYVSK
ncbi:MAG: antibiotic biosynthesis monooxygenase [Acholeplasmataceae bacterium]|nr:antibiotic biosynthesis monooxygenase [Acholeplasmataceae bacterium]